MFSSIYSQLFTTCDTTHLPYNSCFLNIIQFVSFVILPLSLILSRAPYSLLSIPCHTSSLPHPTCCPSFILVVSCYSASCFHLTGSFIASFHLCIIVFTFVFTCMPFIFHLSLSASHLPYPTNPPLPSVILPLVFIPQPPSLLHPIFASPSSPPPSCHTFHLSPLNISFIPSFPLNNLPLFVFSLLFSSHSLLCCSIPSLRHLR